MDILNETKFLMKKYNISANKALGQNFLIDEEIISQIIKNGEIGKEDLIIEIGPGLGTLTNEIAKYAGKIICIELDKRMIEILKDRFILFNNIEIVNADILKIDLNKLIGENSNKKIKIVANLPYYITTPIIMKLLECNAKFDEIIVMVQKEVADRLCAKSGSRKAGAITYIVEYYAETKELFKVPNTSFIPIPNVESEVISLKPRKEKNNQVQNEEKLFKVIKYAFMQRRKTLINAISGTEVCPNKEHIQEILKKLNIEEKIRGEALTLEEFIDISNLL